MSNIVRMTHVSADGRESVRELGYREANELVGMLLGDYTRAGFSRTSTHGTGFQTLYEFRRGADQALILLDNVKGN